VGQTGKPMEWQKGTRYEKAWRTFYTETTRGGVLLHPITHWFVSAAHTDADVDHTLAVCADAFAAVATRFVGHTGTGPVATNVCLS